MARRKSPSTTLPGIIPNVPIPGTRHLTFTDADGRSLSAGDMIRVVGHPRSWQFKVRHLFVTPEGRQSIEAYGPYDRFGKINTANALRIPKYRSFGVDQVAAKVRQD